MSKSYYYSPAVSKRKSIYSKVTGLMITNVLRGETTSIYFLVKSKNLPKYNIPVIKKRVPTKGNLAETF